MDIDPDLTPAIPFLRENQLESYDSVVPGLLRVDVQNTPTIHMRDSFSTLAAPKLQPLQSLSINTLRFDLDGALVKYASRRACARL